jgi:ribokinase
MTVEILGSLNLDVSFSCEALPGPGETVLCSHMASGPGGKGLNQAVAARRAGAAVRMAGAVGTDPNGASLLSFLENEGIDTGGIARLADAATGLAHIVVDRSGENSIVVASGANQQASPPPRSAGNVASRVRLAQLEIGVETVGAFLREGRSVGSTTILNAAPALPEASGIFAFADMLIMNEHELSQFSGASCDDGSEVSITDAAQKILQRADQTIIVTLGAAGTQVIDSRSTLRLPAHPAVAVDTTGAGDCFCGVLAASLATGSSIEEAVRRANKAASLAVQRPGAAGAMPQKAEIDAAR